MGPLVLKKLPNKEPRAGGNKGGARAPPRHPQLSFVGSPGRSRAGEEKDPRPSGQEGGVSRPRPGPPRAGEAKRRVGAAGKAAHAHHSLRRVRKTAHACVGAGRGAERATQGARKGYE